LRENGVFNGGYREIWKQYLPAGSQIHGLDIDKNCASLQFSENIHFHLGNSTDGAFINNTFRDIKFDAIIDDGSHLCKDVIKNFYNLFQFIKPGGVYIVEDLHASYWPDYGGGERRRGSSIEFFKTLIDIINADSIHKYGVATKFTWMQKYLSRKQFIFLKEKLKPILDRQRDAKLARLDTGKMGHDFRRLISQISFFDGVCAVEKFHAEKTKPFQMIGTDNEEYKSDILLEFAATQEEAINLARKLYTGI
jgi:hypothetical protein